MITSYYDTIAVHNSGDDETVLFGPHGLRKFCRTLRIWARATEDFDGCGIVSASVDNERLALDGLTVIVELGSGFLPSLVYRVMEVPAHRLSGPGLPIDISETPIYLRVKGISRGKRVRFGFDVEQ